MKREDCQDNWPERDPPRPKPTSTLGNRSLGVSNKHWV